MERGACFPTWWELVAVEPPGAEPKPDPQELGEAEVAPPATAHSVVRMEQQRRLRRWPRPLPRQPWPHPP